MNRGTRDFSRLGVALIGLSIALAAVTVFVGVQIPPNTLATALLQGITLVFTIAGAYVFANASARQAAREMLIPHVRSAFRRQQNLYGGLGRLLTAIDSQMILADETARLNLLVLRSMVIEQANTADDALEDWHDLVPDEVEQIQAQARLRNEATS